MQNVKSAKRSYRLSLGGDYLSLGPDYIFLALVLHLLCKVSFLHLVHKHSIFLHLQLKMYFCVIYTTYFCSSTIQSIFSSFNMQRFFLHLISKVFVSIEKRVKICSQSIGTNIFQITIEFTGIQWLSD